MQSEILSPTHSFWENVINLRWEHSKTPSINNWKMRLTGAQYAHAKVVEWIKIKELCRVTEENSCTFNVHELQHSWIVSLRDLKTNHKSPKIECTWENVHECAVVQRVTDGEKLLIKWHNKNHITQTCQTDNRNIWVRQPTNSKFSLQVWKYKPSFRL
jgi:hypothetical protein